MNDHHGKKVQTNSLDSLSVMWSCVRIMTEKDDLNSEKTTLQQ